MNAMRPVPQSIEHQAMLLATLLSKRPARYVDLCRDLRIDYQDLRYLIGTLRQMGFELLTDVLQSEGTIVRVPPHAWEHFRDHVSAWATLNAPAE